MKNKAEKIKKIITKLRKKLRACDLCPRQCGVDRTRGEKGFCNSVDRAEVAHVGLHHGEEPPISGVKGSGTIFFKNCNLHCVYCQNWWISQSAPRLRLASSDIITKEELAAEMLRLQKSGAHNINLVTPTHYLPQILESLLLAFENGLELPLVYNTNGYESVETLEMLEGIIDIYLPDIKYGSNESAEKLSGVNDYVEMNKAALKEMHRQVSNKEAVSTIIYGKENKIARKGLLVRHLVLPNDMSNSRACLAYLSKLSRKTCVSLMAQYSPQYKAGAYPEINSFISGALYDDLVDYAQELELKNCWIQELGSSENYLPDFESCKVFKEQ
jgi:putative pyruvate formate lyase activating enzyme